MQASGLLESIKIHTSGYEFRESIESFVDKFWPISLKKMKQNAHETLTSFGGSFAQSNTNNNNMPGSLEDYVTKIFAIASKGDPASPAHPLQQQWALGVTQVFMKGPAKKLIQ